MRHALITGGSRGIGAAAVRAFTAAGYAVSFFYEKNDAAAAAVSAEAGAEAVRCDVTDAQAVLDAVSCLPETDVLVNNAGICHYGLISQITQAQWDRLFAVNVGGIYHCVNAVLPAMLRRQSGCILNVSSMWGQVGASCEACYSATKGAVLALTKALAQELGPSGIRVNCVSPGVILMTWSQTSRRRCLRSWHRRHRSVKTARRRTWHGPWSILRRRSLSRGRTCR